MEQQASHILISSKGSESLLLSECMSLSELPLCAATMMTGWFNAALAKIKGLSDKYHGRLRDCSEKSF